MSYELALIYTTGSVIAACILWHIEYRRRMKAEKKLWDLQGELEALVERWR